MMVRYIYLYCHFDVSPVNCSDSEENFVILEPEYIFKLEFMFMKHYAPNRCEASIEALNFGGGGIQGRCPRRSEVFVKIIFFLFIYLFIYYLFIFLFFFVLGGGGGVSG